MFSSAVKVQKYRKLLQMHETTPSSFQNDAIGLDQWVERKLFETSSVQALKKKKRNLGEMMTTHRVNVKLGIVQIKLRFHGGTRGKERVKKLVSQDTERVLLVLCFDWVLKSVTFLRTTTF
jgi:hypothetical protein